MNDLIKLLPEGSSVVAVIVVVVIFLRNQKEFNVSLKNITDEFSKNVTAMQQDFQKQIDRLSNAYLENEKTYRTQIQKLFDDFITVSRETITAVKGLEATVRELRYQIQGNRKDDENEGKPR